jgi:hypothetical protein
VGKIERYEKKIDLNSDTKRFWLDDLKSFKDKGHCDSMPINPSLVANHISKKSDIKLEDDGKEKYDPESEL